MAAVQAIWQPILRSQLSPPVEVLYHYIRLFAAQGKTLQAWHTLRWLHAAHRIACEKDNTTSSKTALSTLKECIEKGWLFATTGPCPEAIGESNIIVPSKPNTPEHFVPPLDLLYNYADELNKLSLTKTCWHLFEWLLTAFTQACKRDMNPYSSGPTATALKVALATCNIVASPRDVPYMQDYYRVRSSLPSTEECVKVLVNDKLWERLPGTIQIELLEMGRRPQTARDRWGTRTNASCCSHKLKANRLLAAGGCECADREDIPWVNIPLVENSMMNDFISYARLPLSQTPRPLVVEPTPVPVEDDAASDFTSDDEFDDEHNDSDSAYESDEDEEQDDEVKPTALNIVTSAASSQPISTSIKTQLGDITQQNIEVHNWITKMACMGVPSPITIISSRKRSHIDEDGDDESDLCHNKRTRH